MTDRMFSSREVSLLIALSFWCLASCSNAVSSGLSPQERVQLTGQLQDARQTDLRDAMDTRLGAVAAEDYMTQAGKAQTAITKLSENSNVPRSEISDALFVPPKHLSSAQRIELIKQLEQAKVLDDQIWRNHLGGYDPILTEDCAVQGTRIDRVVNKLETERPVAWSEIEEAMVVPNESAW